MVSINFEYDPDFLKEEIRDGHLVTEEMKKLWLVELDILNKFIQICEKYNLTYWAEGGTLLGAVRHKGYIPWDDDIDIMMPRADYDRFSKIIETELEYPYCVQKIHIYTFIKIKRLDTTYIKKSSLYKMVKLLPCINIDIFCADNCPDTTEERHLFQDKLYEANAQYKDSYNTFKKSYHRQSMINKLGQLRENMTDNFEYLAQLCQSYNGQDTQYIFNSGFPSFPIEPGFMRYAEDYSETVDLPFEMLTLKCPKGYERVLDMHYTERTGIPWQTPTKNLAYHDQECEHILDVDNPYTKYCCLYYNKPEDLKDIPQNGIYQF